ncbi:MAG: hypothetical protein ACRDCT_15120 [Shewanella sp.]|uniref:hypothetical protein n=1 Tax=Shewanella sp. TaxID=50422 RepID=UPI003F3C7B45
MTHQLSESEFVVTDYLKETPSGYKVCHFLGVYDGIIADDLPLMQSLLLSRIKAFNLAMTSGHYKKAVEIVTPARRIKLIVDLVSEGMISLQQAWALARQAWLFQPNIYQERVHWELFFNIAKLCTHEFMCDQEREHLHQLPEEVDIFRGYDQRYGRAGLSWTLSKVVASDHSKRYGNRIIAHSKIRKADIVAYLNVKSEYEIVIPSMSVVENFRAINVINQRKYSRWQGLGHKNPIF